MNDYCKLCGAPVPIGSDVALCWQHGGYPLTPESQIRCPFCRELILAEAKKILPVPLSSSAVLRARRVGSTSFAEDCLQFSQMLREHLDRIVHVKEVFGPIFVVAGLMDP